MKTQIFLLHFAGGNRYSYQFITPQLLLYFDVIPIELPGRGKRISEPLLRNFSDASRDLYKQITSKLSDNKFIIYGHSMGALLALSITSMLQDSGRAPDYLFVSGSAGPEKTENINRHLLDRQSFINELKEMGGMPQGVIENQDLFQFFEPIIRADFEIISKNQIEIFPKLETPVFAIMGSREKNVENISDWQKVTKGAFNYEVLEGGHFFIYDHSQRIVDLIGCWTKNIPGILP